MPDAPRDPATDLDAYALVLVRLAQPGADRAAVLQGAGLDEASWDAVDDVWQEKLSEATGAIEQEGDRAIPVLLEAFDVAMKRAQSALANGDVPVPLARFAQALRAIERQADVGEALRVAGLTTAQFLAANQHWTARIVVDPELEAELRRLLG